MTEAGITIIDYGMGNLGSIKNMLKKIGILSQISSNPDVIVNSKKLILPGVGSFDEGMKNLHNRKLIPILNKMVLQKKIPILGICLGMQLFSNSSEEGVLPGLGWIPSKTIKFIDNGSLKIPHMGWNNINPEKQHAILTGLDSNSRFYFVHSYHFVCENKNDILTKTEYRIAFTSSVAKDNIIGVQFHPEKSHKYGMQLLKNYSTL